MKRAYLILVLFFILGLLYANPYEVRRFEDENGRTIVQTVIPGIPEHLRQPGPIAAPSRSAVILNDVPKLNWVYGCSATAAAMIAGYYDRKGYPNMYSGPTNGGVFPLNNAVWGYGECPLSATHQGYDGLNSWGHVNRFWTGSGNSGDDPFGTGNPTGTYQNCTADFMGTNQDWWNNEDGATSFFNYGDGSPLYNYSGHENESPRARDGIRGFRLFMESRGYQVSTNYNQYIHGYSGNTAGYTLVQFKQSIDNGIPVFIHIQGHSMLGVGYETTNNTIYIHDTWDHQMHSMQWGGYYSNAQHYGVSVIQISTPPQSANISWNPGSFTQTLDTNSTASQNLTIGNTGNTDLQYSMHLEVFSETALSEGFEGGTMPTGWTQEYISGSYTNWEFQNGGFNSVPPSAYSGIFNAHIKSSNSAVGVQKLISPVIDLSDANSAKLSFYHTLPDFTHYLPYPPYFMYSIPELKVYYRRGTGAWQLLAHYTEDLQDWTYREIDLPNLGANYQLAFESHISAGWGLCLDEVKIEQECHPVPWLRINNATNYTGTMIPSATSNKAINFNSTGLAAGTYQTNIFINSNSLQNSNLTIPVTLNVVLSPPGTPENPIVSRVLESGNVRIEWSAVPGPINGYKVYFCPDANFGSNTQHIATTVANRLYYIDNNANTRPKGFYRVVAYRN